MILLSFSSSIFATEICDPKKFSCYKENLTNLCNNPASPWNVGPNLWKITEDYADFTSEAQNTKAQAIIVSEKNPESQTNLEKMLSPDRIWSFDWFRWVEIARIQYRNNMNRIFSCAIAAGRAEKLNKLLNIPKLSSEGSDIRTKLTNEKKRYENIMINANCNQNTDGSITISIVDRLVRSATIEYCGYQYYLDYLDSNIKQDYTQALEQEKKIGNNGKYAIPQNTDTFLQKLTNSIWSIENELSRSKNTIQKAVVAYREMERTYTIHMLLVIIYDDYLNLRDNLKNYMNNLSQTFEKANNAQDANQR